METPLLPSRAVPVDEQALTLTVEAEAPSSSEILDFASYHGPSLEGAVTSVVVLVIYAFRRKLISALKWLKA